MILTVTLNAAIDKRYVVEGVLNGEVHRVKECTCVPGGKGINVSKTAVLAGTQVLATGFVGGHTGKWIEESLEEYGVKQAFYHVKEESRTCINLWDETAHTQTEFLEPGFHVEKEDLEGFFLLYESLLPKVKVVVLSGSLPQGVDSSCYQRLIERGKRLGKKVILDTSGRLLEDGVQWKPSLIKPNEDEIATLTGRDCRKLEEVAEAARSLQQSGIEVVVVSLGKKGAIVAAKEGVFRVSVPKVDAVNTVGCGDTMTAGLAIGLLEEKGIEEMMKCSAAMASAAALHKETGYFRKEDMQKLYGEIRVQPFS